MNGSWTRLTLTLVLLAHLSHNAVVCQDFLDKDDREKLDELFKSVTLNPSIFGSRGDGEDIGFKVITSVYQFDFEATKVSSDVDQMTDWQTSTMTPGGEGTSDGGYLYTTRRSFEDSVEEERTVSTFHENVKIKCVEKEHIKNRDAVKLNLIRPSNCEDTKKRTMDIHSYLCRDNCELLIFQEENSNQVIFSGESVEANAKSMAAKFYEEEVKKKLRVREVSTYWGKHSPAVFISLLVSGLLLAALLIGFYILKNHRGHNAKGMRLAEDPFQVDEESQGNTLMSVAPLPQEPQPPEKPSVNGESPDGGKSQPPPTNGHQAAKTPVADTEL
ncbi:hypothetical protein GN956_G20070 [Arapaima gigas]